MRITEGKTKTLIKQKPLPPITEKENPNDFLIFLLMCVICGLIGAAIIIYLGWQVFKYFGLI